MSKTNIENKCYTTGKRRLAVGMLGLFLALGGLICVLLWELTLNIMLDRAMILRPNSRIFDFWKSPPMDINLDFYLFNWTNPQDFRNLSTKPILQQMGPYRFIELPNKVDIHWHPENASVSYRRQSHFKFIATDSRGSLSDQIVTLNPVALAATGIAKRCNYMRRSMIDLALKIYGDDISVTKTVDELLFTGYNDVLLDVLNAMPRLLHNFEVPFDKFGYCYTRNGSSTLMGLYNIFTGADDISKIGQVHTWNNKKHTGKFGSHCGMINGSAGEFQPPRLEENGIAHIFIPELCRTIPLEYVETVQVEGVKGYKYIGGLRAVDNGTLYPENKCFCDGQCAPSGVMNMSSCWYDAPLFMSYPHFYNADPYYVDSVVGLQPNKDQHECSVTLEPRTGFVLDVAARMQLNMLVEPVPYLDLFKKVPRVLFPLLWFEETIRVTPDLASDLRMWPTTMIAGKVVGTVVLFIGIGLMTWYCMHIYYNPTKGVGLQLSIDDGDRSMKSTKSNLETIIDIQNTVLADLPIQPRSQKTKVVIQSTSIDSGCPGMDESDEQSDKNNSGGERH